MIEQLSRFVTNASYEDMSAEALRQIKVRVLDSLACAIGAIGVEPMARLRNQIEVFGGRPLATLIGGLKTSPDRAALCNGALTQYLGFNDSFLFGNGSSQPSDSFSAVVAVSEYAGASFRSPALEPHQYLVKGGSEARRLFIRTGVMEAGCKS